MQDNDPTPKMVSAPIRMSPELAEKVAEAKQMTGLAQADILRLALAIGLEDLKKVGFDLARLISDAARTELSKSAGSADVISMHRGGLTVIESKRSQVGESESEERHVSRMVDEPAARLEIKGGIAAGSPMPSDPAGSSIAVAKSYPKGHYVFQIFGKSMEPEIPDRSHVVVKPWNDGYPKKGTKVIYRDAYGATLKVYDTRKAGPGDEAETGSRIHVLRSLNPEYPDVDIMDGGKIEAVLVEVL